MESKLKPTSNSIRVCATTWSRISGEGTICGTISGRWVPSCTAARTEELQEYIGSYLAELEKVESRKLSENSVLNEVLSYYIIQAEQNGIRVKSDIQVQGSYPFDIMDMTVLLGNAMENAICACRECPPDRRRIYVAIRQLKKSILIKLENDVSEAEDFGRNQRLVKNIRGYGMESIELVARKYQAVSRPGRKSKDLY